MLKFNSLSEKLKDIDSLKGKMLRIEFQTGLNCMAHDVKDESIEETIKEEIELLHDYLKVEKKQEPAQESKTLLVKKK